MVLDGFIKDDSTLDGSYPTQIAVLAGARHHCLVEVNYKYSHNRLQATELAAQHHVDTISLIFGIMVQNFSQASEMSQSINIDGFRLISRCILVIWKWEWMSNCQLPEQDSDVVSHTSITVIPETSDEEDKDDDIEDNHESALNLSQLQSSITHSVVFKCIGCTKEH